MKTTTTNVRVQNPLRSLRETFCTCRVTFCRRYGLSYGSVHQAEIGMVEHPANFIRTLSVLSNTPQDLLLSQYAAWRESERAAS